MQKIKRMTDLEVEEISLVDSPAIKRKFLVIKKDEQGGEIMDEELEMERIFPVEDETEKSLTEEDLETAKNLLEVLGKFSDQAPSGISEMSEVLKQALEYSEKKLDEDQTKDLKEALKILTMIKTSCSPKVQYAIETLAGAAGYGYPKPSLYYGGYKYPSPRSYGYPGSYPEPTEKEDTEKTGKKFSGSTSGILKKVLAQLDGVILELKELTGLDFGKAEDEDGTEVAKGKTIETGKNKQDTEKETEKQYTEKEIENLVIRKVKEKLESK